MPATKEPCHVPGQELTCGLKGGRAVDGEIYLRRNVGDLDAAVRISVGAAMVALPVLTGLGSGRSALLAGLGATQVLEGVTRY